MLEYLRLVITCGWYILWMTPRIRRYARHPEKYPLQVRYEAVRSVIRRVLDHWHVDYHVRDFEKYHDYDGKRLIIMNHCSILDPLCFIAQSDRPMMMLAKKQVEKYPFVGAYMKAMGGLFLDRENLMNQIRTLNEAMKIAKDPNGPDVCIFPEGTRNKNPGTRCLDFHAGTFKIAMKSNVAIFPVSVYGPFRMSTTKIHLKKYPVYITCFDPIMPSEFTSENSYEIAGRAKKLIDDNVLEMKKTDIAVLNEMKLKGKNKENALASDLIEF